MARPRRNGRVPQFSLPFMPILLKELALACDITQGELAGITGTSRTTINLCFNRGYVPMTIADFRPKVESHIRGHERAMAWLCKGGHDLSEIWAPLGQDMKGKHPSGIVQRSLEGKRKKAQGLDEPAPASPKWEVEMLHPEAMKRFRIFRHPFVNDINGEADIFCSDEHRYIEIAMMDAAHHAGFLAVVGEVQSGKSVIRKKVMENLKRDGSVVVIHPRSSRINTENKLYSRINPVSLCDAIIMDISGEPPKIRTEQKVRQLERLLITRANQGQKHVLIIEEAHNLTPVAFKYLKQFYEIEDGFKKLLGIILIAQPEFKEMLDEKKHQDTREVIRRIQMAEIRGLGNNLRGYLEFKFKRVGARFDNIFTEEGFAALERRFTEEDLKKNKISTAYPGLVNMYVTRAINLAHETGEAKVTADVVEAL